MGNNTLPQVAAVILMDNTRNCQFILSKAQITILILHSSNSFLHRINSQSQFNLTSLQDKLPPIMKIHYQSNRFSKSIKSNLIPTWLLCNLVGSFQTFPFMGDGVKLQPQQLYHQCLLTCMTISPKLTISEEALLFSSMKMSLLSSLTCTSKDTRTVTSIIWVESISTMLTFNTSLNKTASQLLL